MPENEITEIKRSPEEIPAVLEAVLFAAGYPLPYEKLSEVTGLSEEEVIKEVKALSKKYEGKNKGLMILLYKDSCQMCTREEYAPEVRIALGIKQGGRLSNSALEVLAIVAYSQPVTKLQIERIRGVDSQYAVASLCAKNLIEAKGRLDLPGRPVIYGTTADFLRCFGISSLDELPEASAFIKTAQVTLEEAANEEMANEISSSEPSALTDGTVNTESADNTPEVPESAGENADTEKDVEQ